MKGYELTNFEWGVIAPLLPNKPRGVPRVDDRRVLNGIFWVLRTGAPWRALPREFGPPTHDAGHLVGQSDGDQHFRLTSQHLSKPRPLGCSASAGLWALLVKGGTYRTPVAAA